MPDCLRLTTMAGMLFHFFIPYEATLLNLLILGVVASSWLTNLGLSFCGLEFANIEPCLIVAVNKTCSFT